MDTLPYRHPESKIETKVGVLDKSVEILDIIAGGPRALAELTSATGLPRPTAHRLAQSLEQQGLLGRDGLERYVLGPRLLAWAQHHHPYGELARRAQPVIDALCHVSGESAQLYVRDGVTRVCVAACEPRAGLFDTVPVGVRLPIDKGSGGKVILAYTDDSFKPGEKIREVGFAFSVGERDPGVASVSAPVFDAGGHLIGSISVSGPQARFLPDPGTKFSELVKQYAEVLERELAPGH